jgi:hypothetical protein
VRNDSDRYVIDKARDARPELNALLTLPSTLAQLLLL